MKRGVRNILFIMYDQLRFDYLGCAGHPHLATPNMDWLAAEGVRFPRCYVQSPICGASRMSTYTGRYVQSHGAAWNNVPLKVGELTLGDHLRAGGMECWLVGKTHMKADAAGLERLGIARDGVIGARVSECGFDIHVRDDGLWAEGPDGYYDRRRSPYNAYLGAQGYDGSNPWQDYANASVDETGSIASGWFLKHSVRPANIRNEDSETPWLTDRMIEFLEGREAGAAPWLAHLSYIKPHWPYIVPAPYHDMYGKADIQKVLRHPSEQLDAHPIYAAFMANPYGRAFSRDEVRETVIPAYMGLIRQCDDELGRLLDYMRRSGRIDDTLIVLTSDHGDYLGDHWLGEKDLFHDVSAKVPLIIRDPSPEADAKRGSVCDELVEAIDLAPTFVDFSGQKVPGHILEGRSLLPILRGESREGWRDAAFSEYDYSATEMAAEIGVSPRDARLFMVADKRWKMIHAEGGFRPMLFDLQNDPEEFFDLGASADHADIIARLYDRLAEWGRRMSQRTTVTDAEMIARRGGADRVGILLGVYDENEVAPDVRQKLTGPARQDHLSGSGRSRDP